MDYKNVDKLIHVIKKIYKKKFGNEFLINDEERLVLKKILDKNNIKEDDFRLKKRDLLLLFKK